MQNLFFLSPSTSLHQDIHLPHKKNSIVTSVIGKIDCRTVKADAPVSPRFETDFRWVFCIASTVDGRRWSSTSLISGSSFLPHMLEGAVGA
jgi:hypothetical protein